jgi:4-hydroxybenzoate polyprenyltransferase
MKDSNEIYKIGKRRALIHLLFLPLTIFTIMLIVEKQYSLVVPMAYVLIVGIAQYIRLIKTEKKHLEIYSRTFFDVLKQVSIITFIAIILILLGVVL